MLRGFLDWLSRRRAERDIHRQLDPAVFLDMAEDLRRLAERALAAHPDNTDLHGRVAAIQKELDRLDALARTPQFAGLSTGEKLVLKRGLQQSREQILSSLHAAPPPTERRQ